MNRGVFRKRTVSFTVGDSGQHWRHDHHRRVAHRCSPSPGPRFSLADKEHPLLLSPLPLLPLPLPRLSLTLASRSARRSAAAHHRHGRRRARPSRSKPTTSSAPPTSPLSPRRLPRAGTPPVARIGAVPHRLRPPRRSPSPPLWTYPDRPEEIGRASCRERVYVLV